MVLINIHIFAKQKYTNMSKKVINKIKYCLPNECDNTPTEEIEVGNEIHIYCCEKGFLQTMEEFTSSPLKEPHNISDDNTPPKEDNTNNLNHVLILVFSI